MKLKNKGILYFFAALLFMNGVSRVAASFTVAQVQVEEPKQGKIIHTVTGSGMVDKMKEQAVYAIEDVLVAEVAVQQGQNVSKGDVLAHLDMDSLQEKIGSLAGEIEVMRLQNMDIAATKHKEERDKNRAKTRASEDYKNTVSQSGRKIEEAKRNVKDAKARVEETKKQAKKQAEDGDSVKEAEEALKEAKKILEDVRQQAKDEKRQAKRNLEDVSEKGADSHQAEINEIQILEKQKQLAELEKVRDNGGKIRAQMEGTVTKVWLEVGQRTGGTAAFLMSDTSEGMSFTAKISKEDAVYVTVNDTVTLRTVDKEYEELLVVSVETDEDEAVKVTVFVPKDTLSIGEYADMELTKTSGEYGVTLSLAAIHTENDKNYVYVMVPKETVLGEQYVAQRMDVTVAEKNEMCAALTNSGLMAESQVIVSSDQMISEGERVRLEENKGVNE